MADAPKLVTLLNRSKRHFDVLDSEGKPFRHSPGAMASYTEEQAKELLGYVEMVDISKLPGRKDTSALESQNAALQAEKKALEEKLAALEAAAKPSAAPAAPEEAPAPKRSSKRDA